jgi:predicted amidohydrolase YtcJ
VSAGNQFDGVDARSDAARGDPNGLKPCSFSFQSSPNQSATILVTRKILPLPFVAFLAGACCSVAGPAATLYVNGRIVTLDPQERVAEAMAVDDGRLTAVGTDAEVRKLAGPGTKIVDFGGKTVLPGLIETHCHSIGAARAALTGEYQELHSIAEIQKWVRAQAAKLAPGQWITVPRNEITRLEERRFPTPGELDAATADHPVMFVSVTKTVLNSAGWKALGVVDSASTVTGGEVVFENGKPVLMRGGQTALQSVMPPFLPPPPSALTDGLKELHAIYNSVGITTIFERATDRAGHDLFRTLAGNGELSTRVRTTFRFSARDAAGVDSYVKKLGLKAGDGDDMVRATCLKITVDGGIHWGTTWLGEPHGEKRTAFYRNTDPGYVGQKNYTQEQMRAIFGEANRLGWPVSAHVTGDGGAMEVLRAVEAVASGQPDIKERRFNLIHCYFPSDEMVSLAKKLNAGVDTQGYLYYRDSDFISRIYGRAWAGRFIGLGAWARGGVPVAINSDHMIGYDPDHAMNSFNPFLMLSIAVTRKNDLGEVHGAHQRLSRLDALRAVTLWAAWLSFDEQKLGSLEAGKLADFVVIDRDYLTCPEDEIKDIRPLRTVLGGRTVWER